MEEKYIKIKLQSFIDLITNSSTEVFSTVDTNSVEGLYKMLDAVLKVGGSNLKAKDILEIRVEFDESGIDSYSDYIFDLINADKEYLESSNYIKYLNLRDLYHNTKDNSYDDDFWEHKEFMVKDYSKKDGVKSFDEYCKDYNNDSNEWIIESHIVMKFKDPFIDSKILDIINNLFNHEAHYC